MSLSDAQGSVTLECTSMYRKWLVPTEVIAISESSVRDKTLKTWEKEPEI